MPYWVGGSGNWSDAANHWAAVSGGAPGAGNLPTSTTDAHFDAASNATAYTVTVDATANCRDLMFDAAPSVSGTITLTGSQAVVVYGSLSMLSGMTNSLTGSINLWATSTGKTVTMNGVVLAGALIVSGAGAGYTLQDNLQVNAQLQLNQGALDLNGKAVQAYSFRGDGSNVRALTFNGSTMTLIGGGGSWGVGTSPTNFTLTMGTTGSIVITVGAFAGGGLSYTGSVSMTNQAAGTAITGANTFGNLTLLGRAIKTDAAFTLAANQVVTGTLKYLGNSAVNRLRIESDTLGTPRTITAAAIDAASNYTNFMDIIGAGAAAPFATGSSIGDHLGNSGITFTPAAPQYFYAPTTGTKNWSDAANWFLGSGGTGGAGRVPLPQDNAIFNSASFGATGITVNRDMPSLGKDITWTGVTNAPLFSGAATGHYIFGSLTFGAGMTTNAGSTFEFKGRGSHTITSAGVSMSSIFLNINTSGGTYSLADAISAANITTTSGTFTSNGYSISLTTRFSQVGGVINLGASTVLINYSASPAAFACFVHNGGTWNAGTSTLKLNLASTSGYVTYQLNSGSYGNVWITGTGAARAIISAGSNTFNDFRVDPGMTVQFAAGTTQTAATWHIDGRVATGTDAPCVWCDGATTLTRFSTPNGVGNAFVNDFQFDICITPPAFSGATNTILLGKWYAAPNLAFLLTVTPGGLLSLYLSTDGTNSLGPYLSTASVTSLITSGQDFWMQVKRTASTGNIVYSTGNDGVSWTPLGATVAGVTGAIYASTLEFNVFGLLGGGFASLTGKGKRVRGYTTIGGSPVADFDPSRYSGSGNTVVAVTGETYTRNGNAQFTATNLTTLAGVTDAAYTLAKSGGGVVACRDLSLRNATASPAATFYAGASSFDGGGNTNWLWQNLALMSGDAAAAAAASGALDSGIALAGVALSVAGAGGTLTTAIPLSAAAVAVSAADGILNAQITLSGAALAEAAAAAGLDTGIPLDGLASGAAAASGTLTVQIVLSGDAAAAAGAGGDLTAQVQLSAVAIAQAVASGSLTTEIPLAAFAQAQASVVADFVTRPRIHGYRLETSHARTTHLIARDVRIEQ